jgi:hypothetical protein
MYGDGMSTLTDSITSWGEDRLRSEDPFLGQDIIATEAQQRESPEWEVCIDALLRIWSDSSSLDEPQPNRSAIEAAISWTAFLRKRFPSDPPTCIIPEPDGGVIIERRVRMASGHEWLCELTFYNDERAERTDYYDGRVVQVAAIPRQPHGLNV